MLAAGGAGSIALGAFGAVIVVATALDLFLTVFNYDGFTFIAGRMHRALWATVRTVTRLLPTRLRHAALSVGSAGMLPATVALWLGLEVTGFALMYAHSLATGTAFYLSGGAISSLTLGDVIPRNGLDRALIDLETILGLATFTLALGYVVTSFGALGALENLHGLVRRHAEDTDRPSSILARHFRGGSPADLPAYLQALGDDLESYDQGLRRYPVVYYFHTRRTRRSIPHVFSALGHLVALLRWGLPSSEPVTEDPFLAALEDGYVVTLDRLRRSFVGPDPIEPPEPVSREEFARGDDEWVRAFGVLTHRAQAAAEIEREDGDAYARYLAWLPFGYRQRVVLERVADRLGYERPRSPSSQGTLT